MYSMIFHVDLDAFYASVEQRDNPAIKGKPVIVGARPGSRGVVSACSYEARKFGIHSAMPISIAHRKCPYGVFLPVRMDRYMEVSESIMKLLKNYTPIFQQISVDEAFLDMTGTERLFGRPLEVAAEIKARVKKTTGLTLSVGIAPNKYLAKLASEFNKPDGACRVLPGEEEAFLDKLQLKDLWGIGKKTLARLRELNIQDIPGLRRFSVTILSSMLGEGTGSFLYKVVRGENPGIMSDTPKNRSISNETTFGTDSKDLLSLNNVLLELSHQVMFRLIHNNFHGKTIAIKVRFSDFKTITLRKTLKHNIFSAEEIFQIAKDLFHSKWDGTTPIRLLGVGIANVTKQEFHTQQELFEDSFDKKNKVEEAVFKIHKKIGGASLTKASLLNKKRDYFSKKNMPEKK